MNKFEKATAVQKCFERQEPVKNKKRLDQMDLRLLRSLLGRKCVRNHNRLELS